jgi:hypothetical protein
MTQERDRRMAGGHDKGCPDRLLAEELVHDPVLYPLHDRLAEEPNDGSVDPGGHKTERVTSGDKAVVGLQFFESGPDDAETWKAIEAAAEGVAHVFVGMDQPKALHVVSRPG